MAFTFTPEQLISAVEKSAESKELVGAPIPHEQAVTATKEVLNQLAELANQAISIA